MANAPGNDFGETTPNLPWLRGSDDSESIQNAVNAAQARGGKVTVPAFNARTGQPGWTFTRAVTLPAGTTVVLDNCHLVMADEMMDNFFRSANAYTPEGRTSAGELRGIKIIGVGNAVLDGGRPNGLTESTGGRNGLPPVIFNTPILLVNVRDFEVSGLTIKDHRYWGMCFNFCSFGRIDRIRFLAHGTCNNQDGVNIRNGCHDIVVENLSGQTNDDMLAFSGIDRRDAATNKWSRDVADADPDIRAITVRNLLGAAANHPFLSIRNHDGVKIYDIHISRISDAEYQEPMASGEKPGRYAMIRLGQNLYWHNRRSEPGETEGITIRDVDARHSDVCIIANATLKNVIISGIHCAGKCRAALTTFGAAWSAPGVKMENVVLENISVESDHPDATLAEFPLFAPGQYIRDCRIVEGSLEKKGRRTLVARLEVNKDFDKVEMEKFVKESDAATLAAHHYRELTGTEAGDAPGGRRAYIRPEIPEGEKRVDGVILTDDGPLVTHLTRDLVFVAAPGPVRVECWGEVHDAGSGVYYFCKEQDKYTW